MDDVVVQVVPLHNSSSEEGVSKLFSSAWVNYEASVIVPYVTVYGVARDEVLVCTWADKSTRFLLFCEWTDKFSAMLCAGTLFYVLQPCLRERATTFLQSALCLIYTLSCMYDTYVSKYVCMHTCMFASRAVHPCARANVRMFRSTYRTDYSVNYADSRERKHIGCTCACVYTLCCYCCCCCSCCCF